MKATSLNDKWRCKLNFKNVSVENEMYGVKNYDANDNNLVSLGIPKSFNLGEII